MNEDTRIQQFKQMTEADPENELGHLSLGRAYLETGRSEVAIEPLCRALELNPSMSKAYQMLGEAYDKTGQRDRAIEVMTQGVTIADHQGDLGPRDAMAAMLRDRGAPVPAFKTAGESAGPAGVTGASTAGFACSRCAGPGGQLPKSPFKGPLGEKIYANVCAACWGEWIGMGTKVINELGLVLSTKAGQDTYDQYMIEFLQLEDR